MTAYGLGSQLTQYAAIASAYSLSGTTYYADGKLYCEFTGTNGAVSTLANTPYSGAYCLDLLPAQKTDLTTTSSAVLTGTPASPQFTAQDVEFSCWVRDLEHRRQNHAPQSWETGPWMYWRYDNLTSPSEGNYHYYVALKRSGLEIGRTKDPAQAYGETTPSTQQNVLSSTSSFKSVFGHWYFLEVKQVGAVINIWVDGIQYFTNYTDADANGSAPYQKSANARTGRVGFYAEDSHAQFFDLRVQSLD